MGTVNNLKLIFLSGYYDDLCRCKCRSANLIPLTQVWLSVITRKIPVLSAECSFDSSSRFPFVTLFALKRLTVYKEGRLYRYI